MDQRIEELRRRAELEPDNLALRLQLVNDAAAAARYELLWLALADREVWNQIAEPLQDKAIELVSEQLGSDFSWMETVRYECAGLSHRIAVFMHDKSSIVFHCLPGGTYQMGAVEGDLQARSEERPRHKCVVEPFLLGRYPVLWQEWARFDRRVKNRQPSFPAEGIGWPEVHRCVASWGDPLRLPSEAEWEYAARAGSETVFYWGQDVDDRYLWHGDNSGLGTQSVLKHTEQHNAFGLVDMLGNVGEWCADHDFEGYQNGPYDSRPRLKPRGKVHVIRGGKAAWPAQENRCSSRDSDNHFADAIEVGFRVAATLQAFD